MHKISTSILLTNENYPASGFLLDLFKGISSVIIYHFSLINFIDDLKSKENKEILSIGEKKSDGTHDAKLVQRFSQLKGKSERDYYTLFANFVALNSTFATYSSFFDKNCEFLKHEISYLLSKYPLLMDFKYKAGTFLR